jgi:hypothetical protein
VLPSPSFIAVRAVSAVSAIAVSNSGLARHPNSSPALRGTSVPSEAVAESIVAREWLLHDAGSTAGFALAIAAFARLLVASMLLAISIVRPA